jgi:hypothetical protein
MARFLARVDRYKQIIPAEPNRVLRYVGKEIWVSIHDQPTVGLRSDSARGYQWGVVYRSIAEETGNDPDSIHYGLKREAVRVGILPPEYILAGTTLLEAKPTTKQEDEVFWSYIGWIREGAETGSLFGMKFHIPEPNE